MENKEEPVDITDKESVTDDEMKIEKPKKPRPPPSQAQIEARKKNFEKMLKKRTEESLALAQKKVEEKLKKKEERKLDKVENKVDPKPVDTPKPVAKKAIEPEYEVIEEHITKKPKKKKIIYREESDSEEEVVIVKKKKEKQVVEQTLVEQPKIEIPKQIIRFF